MATFPPGSEAKNETVGGERMRQIQGTKAEGLTNVQKDMGIAPIKTADDRNLMHPSSARSSFSESDPRWCRGRHAALLPGQCDGPPLGGGNLGDESHNLLNPLANLVN